MERLTRHVDNRQTKTVLPRSWIVPRYGERGCRSSATKVSIKQSSNHTPVMQAVLLWKQKVQGWGIGMMKKDPNVSKE